MLFSAGKSDASLYRKYRYMASISLYQIVPYRPPHYRFLTIFRHGHFLFFRVDFTFLDSNDGNKECSYDRGRIE